MRVFDRHEIVAGAFSSDPENSAGTGAAPTVTPDRVYPDHAEMAASEDSRDNGTHVAIVATPNRLHFEPCR